MTNKSHEMMYYVVRGLQQRLESVFSLASSPQLKLTNDTFSQILQTGGGARNDNPNVAYPITSIRPTAVQVDEEGLRPGMMVRKGFARRFGLYTENTSTVASYNVVPVVIPFEFSYITDDPFAFIDFATKWVYHSNSGECNYTIKYRGVQFTIRVKLDPQFEVPEKEGGYESQAQAIAVSTITVHAYAPGTIEEVDRKTLTPESVFNGLVLMPQRTKVS